MTFGFFLTRLALLETGEEPTYIRFTRGLNVIAGPSDTGKTFIAQCIDYALGSGTTPKDIPEAKRYHSVVLDIEANDDQRAYSLERSLRGGDVLCKTAGRDDRMLAAKHEGGKEDTVSQFLLGLSGLGAKKVRINESGKTRPLSFRDISKFVIVDEIEVIEEASPVLGRQVIHKTAYSGVFRILLTGTDDSSIIAKEDSKVAKGRQAGRVEVIEGLLNTVRGRLVETAVASTLAEERRRLTLLEASVQTALLERAAAQADVAPLQARRNAAWTSLKAAESKLAVLSELRTRFDLLQAQYESDLRRLESIAEAGLRLAQLEQERCPVCGALAEHQHKIHVNEVSSPTDVTQACKVEAVKTSRLLQGLQSTRNANSSQVEQLRVIRDARSSDFATVSMQLKALMEQRVDVASNAVDDLRTQVNVCRTAIEQFERVQELEDLLRDAQRPKTKAKKNVAGAAVTVAQADSFSRQVEEILRAWQFPDLDRVSYSESDQDVVISGRARKNRGKGVRAITRAAFNLALLRLCVEDERPFPNFVLIDSPLLVYEEPDADESSFPSDLKQHFWESMTILFADAQVIVIENIRQLPEDETLAKANVILFTGNDRERRGFLKRASI